MALKRNSSVALTGSWSTTARLGLPAASRCVRENEGEHVHKKMFRYEDRSRCPKCRAATAGRQLNAPRAWRIRGRGGAAGLVGASKDPCMHVRTCVHEIEVILTLTIPGRKGFPGGDASVHGGRHSSELGSGRLTVSLCPTRKACACAWVHYGCACT